jgi:multidrug resistance efflux pump
MPTETATDNKNESQSSDKVARVIRIVSIICVVLFLWYVFSDRFTPYTDQGRVKGYVIPIVPEVSGKVVKVNVEQNQTVDANAILIELEKARFKLAVQEAEAALEIAGQDVGADTATVSAAQADVVEAKANLDNIMLQSKRVFKLEKRKLIPVSDADKTRSTIIKAKAQLASSKAELARTREQLGQAGANNPKVKSAIAELADARLDLEKASIRAPADGYVTNLSIDVGNYATAGRGKAVMTFVSISDVWVQANMRENSIGNVKPGDKVEISLDVAPGRIFKGVVASIGVGVGEREQQGELYKIEETSGWLREAQRFPVIIRFSDNEAKGFRRFGGQADVVIYTGNNWILNPLGWMLIRINSYLSYIY